MQHGGCVHRMLYGRCHCCQPFCGRPNRSQRQHRTQLLLPALLGRDDSLLQRRHTSLLTLLVQLAPLHASADSSQASLAVHATQVSPRSSFAIWGIGSRPNGSTDNISVGSYECCVLIRTSHLPCMAQQSLPYHDMEVFAASLLTPSQACMAMDIVNDSSCTACSSG